MRVSPVLGVLKLPGPKSTLRFFRLRFIFSVESFAEVQVINGPACRNHQLAEVFPFHKTLRDFAGFSGSFWLFLTFKRPGINQGLQGCAGNRTTAVGHALHGARLLRFHSIDPPKPDHFTRNRESVAVKNPDLLTLSPGQIQGRAPRGKTA